MKMTIYAKSFALCTSLLLMCAYLSSHAQNKLDSATFAKRFPNKKLLDDGKLRLYSYRDYDDSTPVLWSVDQPVTMVAAVALKLLESPIDYYCVQLNGQVEVVLTEKDFKEKIKHWFADDILLLSYIQKNKIKSEFFPYLVRMYNGHAPRPFDPDFRETPMSFVADGFMDERDCRLYDIVIVNNQTWLAENLQFCTDQKCLEGRCENCEQYGAYYTWKVATQVCPANWRLPEETDWKTLFLALGLPLERVNKVFGMDKDGALGKKMLKDTINPQGFNAIKAGRLNTNTLEGVNESAFFWTAKEAFTFSADAIEIRKSNKNRAEEMYYNKSKQHNVRCVKNK